MSQMSATLNQAASGAGISRYRLNQLVGLGLVRTWRTKRNGWRMCDPQEVFGAIERLKAGVSPSGKDDAYLAHGRKIRQEVKQRRESAGRG